MSEYLKGKSIYIAALAVLFVFVSLSETTYSLFLHEDETEKFNYNTGLLDLEFVEDEKIILENILPTNDSEALNNKPYKLTIKNVGTLPYMFSLKLVDENNENSIDTQYIKYKINDKLPSNLSLNDSIIASNLVIYPGEEKTFYISVWLDINTPNNELGKIFNAKVVTFGNSIYKTIDTSSANHPELTNDMLAVYYDESSTTWHLADDTNLNKDYAWYNYDESKWANSVVIKNNTKKIYDITRKNDLDISEITYNNGNAVITDKYLDIKLNNYEYNTISNILRVKFDDLNQDKIYLLTNGRISYYYDNSLKKLVFKNTSNQVTSDIINIEKGKWYILGYTYDKNKVTFYVDGKSLSSSNIPGDIASSQSFKIGTDETNEKVSKITIGNILTYNRILSETEIKNNYQTSLNIIRDGLVSGYDIFIPMTLKDYYKTKELGAEISDNDISLQYVWIPRYKYRVWNIAGETNYDNYKAMKKGIDIVFESNNNTTGTIYCEGTNCFSDNLKTMPVTTNDNGKYYTHRAFTKTNEELTGFWISKYEISKSSDNTITSKKGSSVTTNDNLSNYYNMIKNISNNASYHVIKNTEWGSVAYLSHSKYGLCVNGSCVEPSKNNKYISGADALDSTTANIYGVFDMVGSANEYTMSNISNDTNLNLSSSSFGSTPIGTDDVDLYQNNTFILGDATKEIATSPTNYNWYIRTGLFTYSTSNDVKDNNLTTRIVIK